MKLTVKLFATYRQGRFDVAELERPEGTTVARLLEELELPIPELGFVLVRGRHAELSRALAAGDTVSIFPKVGGG
jgi:molybdopterin converting factor small subunit